MGGVKNTGALGGGVGFWVAPPPCLSCPSKTREATFLNQWQPTSSRQVHIQLREFPLGLLLTLRKFSLLFTFCCSRLLLLFCCYCLTLQHCSPLNVRKPYHGQMGFFHACRNTRNGSPVLHYASNLRSSVVEKQHTSNSLNKRPRNLNRTIMNRSQYAAIK